jgi:hypothetical protein
MAQAGMLTPATIGNAIILIAVFLLFSPIAPRPWGWRGSGQVLHVERLSLLGRLRMWGRQVLALAAFAVIGWRLGFVSTWALDVALVAVALALLCPVRYTLTTAGFQIGKAPFRRWTEFGGVTRQQWGVRLQGVAGNPGETVWLSGNHGDDQFVLLMRQLVRGSYKGQFDGAAADGQGAHPVLATVRLPLSPAARS